MGLAALRAAGGGNGANLMRAALVLLAWVVLIDAGYCLPAGARTPPDTTAQRLRGCSACHGEQGRAGTDAYYPRIAGKPEAYLYNQLRNFREGRRHYALMTYLVDYLPDPYLLEIARHFAALNPPYPPPQRIEASPTVLQQGKSIASDGLAVRSVPGCVECHGAALTGDVAPGIPGLLGLPRDYVAAQFGAWRTGRRRAAEPDCMADIAARLTASEVAAVATWLATRPVPAAAARAPAPAPTADAARAVPPLPLECGSARRQPLGPR